MEFHGTLDEGFQDPRLHHHPSTGVSARTRTLWPLACACGLCGVAADERQSRRWREAVYRASFSSSLAIFVPRTRAKAHTSALHPSAPEWYRGLNCAILKIPARRCDRSFDDGDLGRTVSDLRDAALLPPLLRRHGAHACVQSLFFFFFLHRRSFLSPLDYAPLYGRFPTGKVTF